MSKVIFTSLSPNAEKDDVLRALGLLFKPWSWMNGEYVKKVEDWLKEYVGASGVYLTDSGRTGLMMALQALGIGDGDEVLVQAYTCVAVPNSVLWAGATPIYVDIKAETLNISLDDAKMKMSEKTKAIIVQHTFGNPADMTEVMKFAEENNLKVVEDCAHGLGAKFGGKPLGSFGDAAIFSFGRDKVVSAVFGGAVVARDEEVAAKLKELHSALRDMSYVWTLRQVLHPIIFLIAKSLYDFGPVGKVIIEGSKRLGLIAKAVYAEERLGGKPEFIGQRLNNAIAEMAYYQLLKLDKFVAHRRKIAELYDAGLAGMTVKTQITPEQGLCSYLRYFVAVEKADALMNFAKRRSVLPGDWYREVIAPKGVNYSKIGYKQGNCPIAEKVADQSVNLPTHIGIAKKDAERVIDLVKSFYDTNKNN